MKPVQRLFSMQHLVAGKASAPAFDQRYPHDRNWDVPIRKNPNHGVDIGPLGSSLEEPEDWAPAEQVIGCRRW